LIARLREAERGIVDCLLELRPALCKSFEKTHVRIVHPKYNILTDLRMQIHPERKPLSPSQLQNMLPHLVQRYIFPTQIVVSALQSDEVIPDRRSNKYLMSQCAVFFVALVHSIFVLLVDFNHFGHVSSKKIPLLCESPQNKGGHILTRYVW
jgi:hypothetical protein